MIKTSETILKRYAAPETGLHFFLEWRANKKSESDGPDYNKNKIILSRVLFKRNRVKK